MSDELRPETLPPVYRRRRILAIAAGCVVIGVAAIGFIAIATQCPEVQAPVIVTPEVVAVQVPVPPVAPLPPLAPSSASAPSMPRASELSLAFTVAGATYVKIAAVDDIKHGKLRLVVDDGVQVSIGKVAAKDLPDEYKSWAQRSLRFDSGCVAKVSGFALIARVTGSPGYTDLGEETWTAANVFTQGAPVLAARVADCSGTYARDTSLPEVVTLAEVDDQRGLIDQARKLVLASTLSSEAQTRWTKEYEQSGKWYDAEDTKIDAKMLRHPTTGAIWVSIHVYNPEECGDPGGNIWGLFQVANGTLKRAQLRAGSFDTIKNIIDIEGDGELELIGSDDWFTTSIMRADGETLDSTSIAFFGCGC